jgi:hypothetical protein
MSNIHALFLALGFLAVVTAVTFLVTWFLDYSPKAKTRAARNQGYQNGYTFGKVWVGNGNEDKGMEYTYRSLYTTSFENEAYREGFMNGKHWGAKAQNLEKANREAYLVG